MAVPGAPLQHLRAIEAECVIREIERGHHAGGAESLCQNLPAFELHPSRRKAEVLQLRRPKGSEKKANCQGKAVKRH